MKTIYVQTGTYTTHVRDVYNTRPWSKLSCRNSVKSPESVSTIISTIKLSPFIPASEPYTFVDEQ